MQNIISRGPVKHTALLLRPFPQSTRLFSSEAGAQAVTASAPPKAKRWGWSAILLFIPGFSAFGLGTWQLLRREWKVELLEYRRSRLRDDVVPLHVALSLVSKDTGTNSGSREETLQSLEYKRVQCEGIYTEDKSLFLGPRGRTHHGVTERGYFLITPLLPVFDDDTSPQVPVLVNRGWVPGSWRDNPPQQPKENIQEDVPSVDVEKSKKWFSTPLWGKKQEATKVNNPRVKAVKVTGVIRASENPNMFVPPNEPSHGQWFFVDVPAMARAAGLPENTIYVEALQDEHPFKGMQYPDPKDPESLIKSSVMPHDHLSYAFTWYTLSAATTFMAWKRLCK